MKLDEKVVALLDWLDERYDAVAGGKASRAWYALFIVSVPFLIIAVILKWMFDAYKKNFFAFKGDPTVMQTVFVIFTSFIVFLLLAKLCILLKNIMNSTM